VLAFTMILGRLEIFTLLVVLTPVFCGADAPLAAGGGISGSASLAKTRIITDCRIGRQKDANVSRLKNDTFLRALLREPTETRRCG